MIISNRITSCERSLIRKIREDVGDLKIDFNLGLGIPDFPIHPVLQEKIIENIKKGHTTYAPNQGDRGLLDALANYYNVESNEVIITIGAAQALFASMFATFEKGDNVVILCPAYPAYSHVAKLLGVNSRFVGLINGKVDIESLRKQAHGAKMIIACSPNNPNGKVLSKEEVKAIADIAKDNNAILLADECYETLSFNEHISFLGQYENVIKVSSASKMFSATGIRIGWVIAQRSFIEQMVKVQNFTVSGAPLAEQKAVAYCINERIKYNDMHKAFTQRASRASRLLTEKGISHVKPEGAFYIFPKINTGSYDFCLNLAKKRGILTIPGAGFDLGEGHLRISLAISESNIEKGIEIILEELNKENQGE